MTYLQCDITELPHFIEMPEGGMEVLPGLMSLEDKGPIRLTLCFICPVSGPLVFGLQLLCMVWHHIPWCHSWLQKISPEGEGNEKTYTSFLTIIQTLLAY